jgi:hypothetical protein
MANDNFNLDTYDSVCCAERAAVVEFSSVTSDHTQ